MLLTDSRSRQVIPVVGPELFQVAGSEGGKTLYQHVAEQLLEHLELDRSGLPEPYDFYDVVSEFLAQQPTHRKRYKPELVYYLVREIVETQQWEVPKPLRQIASIKGFDLVATTTCDLLMERAMQEARGLGSKGVLSLAYCTKKPWDDLPESWPDQPVPAVYHVFGRVNEINDFAVTDEDVLHYAHRLQSFDRQPKLLFDQFREKRILALGCGFPGWLTRFFLAVTRGEDFFKAGMPGHLADNRSLRNRGLVGFLERKHTNVYTKGGAVEFVAELQARWFERFGEDEDGKADPPVPEVLVAETDIDPVFISFRSEDRDTAREIAARFRAAGIAVFFDETSLKAGDVYEKKIEGVIHQCFCFVPLISKHSILEEPKPRFHRFEWNKAIDAAEFRGRMFQFILPLLVDDTLPDDKRIPSEFRKYQISRMESLEDLVATTRARLRASRVEGRLR